MRPLNGITRDDNKQKSCIYKFKDFTNGGTDIVDQLNDYYTVRSELQKGLRGLLKLPFV